MSGFKGQVVKPMPAQAPTQQDLIIEGLVEMRDAIYELRRICDELSTRLDALEGAKRIVLVGN